MRARELVKMSAELIEENERLTETIHKYGYWANTPDDMPMNADLLMQRSSGEIAVGRYELKDGKYVFYRKVWVSGIEHLEDYDPIADPIVGWALCPTWEVE